ncbi:MAG: hypothetical protein ACOYBJ_02845 [Patescibacteria group bacterium]|jgi:hypothetical protein
MTQSRERVRLGRGDAVVALLLLLLAFAVRWWPQSLVGELPIGFDVLTSYLSFLVDPPNFLEALQLRHGFLAVLAALAQGGDPLAVLRVAGPSVYALFALVAYLFLRLRFRASLLASAAVTALLVFLPVSLRLSWDLWRNLVGLTLVFAGLMLGERRLFAQGVLLAILLVTHELSFLYYLAVLGCWWVFEGVRERGYWVAGAAVIAGATVLVGAVWLDLIPLQSYLEADTAVPVATQWALLGFVLPPVLAFTALLGIFVSHDRRLIVALAAPLVAVLALGLAGLPVPFWDRFAYLSVVPITALLGSVAIWAMRRSSLVASGLFLFLAAALLPLGWSFAFGTGRDAHPLLSVYVPPQLAHTAIDQVFRDDVVPVLRAAAAQGRSGDCLHMNATFGGLASYVLSGTGVRVELHQFVPTASVRSAVDPALVNRSCRGQDYLVHWSQPAGTEPVFTRPSLGLYRYVE